jgi:hypothetical protein
LSQVASVSPVAGFRHGFILFIVSICSINYKTAGLRPRPAPYFLSKPTKSKQKMASPAGGNVVAKSGGFQDDGVNPSCHWFLGTVSLTQVTESRWPLLLLRNGQHGVVE